MIASIRSVNMEQDSVSNEILTPLPPFNIRDKQEVQLPQDIQENTMTFDSQPPIKGNNQLYTYPKYYMRRKKKLVMHPQDDKDNINGRYL